MLQYERIDEYESQQQRSFSLIMVHESGQRQLVSELYQDSFMGCCAGLWKMFSIKTVVIGLLTTGCSTHPDGFLKVCYITDIMQMRDA